MPEGHTIHRIARLHRRDLAGGSVAVSSPQGRFAAGAAELNGRTLCDTNAAGKHLFYRWEGGKTLYVHLGLIGKFRSYRLDPPAPTPATRLAMGNDRVTIYLSGPMTCRLIDPAEEDSIVAKLGPDPLRAGARGLRDFAANLARRRIPIGSALLDQGIVAGIGNVYRAELLFLCRIHPSRPANTLDDSETARLWGTTVRQLRIGEKSGRIVTVDPADVGAKRRASLAEEQRLYVYHRDDCECRRCGARVGRMPLGGRAIWYCPGCQPQ